METDLKKYYPGKFITMKPEEAKILEKLSEKSKFEVLKKIPDIEKILKPLDIYEMKITNKDSLKYLHLVARVKRWQEAAFKDQVKEVKEALAKMAKAKKKGRAPRRRGGGGRISVDDKAAAIKEATKETDLVKKLTSSLERALRSKDPVKGVLDALATWAQEVCVEKLGKPALNGLEKIFKDPMIMPRSLIGWAMGRWNVSGEVYKMIGGAVNCISAALLASGSVLLAKRLRDWWSTVIPMRGVPPRDGQPPRPPDFGGGGDDDDDDDDDRPSRPPSDLDRLRRIQAMKALEQNAQNIEQGINPSKSKGKEDGKSKTDGSKEDGKSKTDGSKEDGKRPPGNNQLGGGGSGSSTSGFSTGSRGGGNPGTTVNPTSAENSSWYNTALGGVSALFGAKLIANMIPQGPQAPQAPPQAPTRRDDGLGFEDQFEREAFEMEEAQRAEREARVEDQAADKAAREQQGLDDFNRDQAARQAAMAAFMGHGDWSQAGALQAPNIVREGLAGAALLSRPFEAMHSLVDRSESIDREVNMKQSVEEAQAEEMRIFDEAINASIAEQEHREMMKAPTSPPRPDLAGGMAAGGEANAPTPEAPPPDAPPPPEAPEAGVDIDIDSMEEALQRVEREDISDAEMAQLVTDFEQEIGIELPTRQERGNFARAPGSVRVGRPRSEFSELMGGDVVSIQKIRQRILELAGDTFKDGDEVINDFEKSIIGDAAMQASGVHFKKSRVTRTGKQAIADFIKRWGIEPLENSPQ